MKTIRKKYMEIVELLSNDEMFRIRGGYERPKVPVEDDIIILSKKPKYW